MHGRCLRSVICAGRVTCAHGDSDLSDHGLWHLVTRHALLENQPAFSRNGRSSYGICPHVRTALFASLTACGSGRMGEVASSCTHCLASVCRSEPRYWGHGRNILAFRGSVILLSRQCCAHNSGRETSACRNGHCPLIDLALKD